MLPCVADLLPCAGGKRKYRPEEQQVNVRWKSSVKAPSTDGGARSSTGENTPGGHQSTQPHILAILSPMLVSWLSEGGI